MCFASASSMVRRALFTAHFRRSRSFTPRPSSTKRSSKARHSTTQPALRIKVMCGISGLANWGNRETLARMTAIQAHRGPNDEGLWQHHSPGGSFFGLGSRRLSILDLSADGHMPMSNEDGTVWISHNGEIYNFKELRRELESKGHSFRSHTDTEVILHLYEQEGVDCVMRLNGMFSFAICDLRGATPTLFMARDHFGIKPFYYCSRNGRLAFASEIKALLEVEGIEASIDLQALDQYLTFLWVPDP